MILDCHTHRPAPYPCGIINLRPGEPLAPGQLYSVGLHPADVPAEPAQALAMVERAAARPQVVAIGECGLDTKCPTPAWLQLKAFRRQAEIAQSAGKPLIIHCVRSAGEVVALRRSLKATVPWVVHGFRGKPTVLAMLLGCGCHISYGALFNPASLRLTPEDRLLAETDCSPLPIEQVIAALAAALHEEPAALTVSAPADFAPVRPDAPPSLVGTHGSCVRVPDPELAPADAPARELAETIARTTAALFPPPLK